MAYRNKVFVSFDGDNDMRFYRLMCAWKQNDHTDFNFFDAHDLNQSRDSSLEISIKSQLRIRLNNTKTFVLLVGDSTRYLVKFVRWEIEQALQRKLPIIAVNLNGTRYRDDVRCPPVLRDSLAIHVSFNAAILQHALEHWPAQFEQLGNAGKMGPYYYSNEIYQQLGL